MAIDRIGTYEYQDHSGCCEIYTEDQPDGTVKMFAATPTNNTLLEHDTSVVYDGSSWEKQDALEELASLIEQDNQYWVTEL